MTRFSLPTHWLQTPPLTGRSALLGAIAALAVPSLIRLSVDGIISGAVYGTYVPFVFLSALLLGWRYATIVAIGAAALADLLFFTPNQLLDGASALFGSGLFMISSALIIGLVYAAGRATADSAAARQACEDSGGLIFSLEAGQAWASWSGASSPVRLGSQHEVADRMEEFLAQLEVGRRLSRHCGIARSSAEPAWSEGTATDQRPF